jgi:phage-related holin
MGLVHSRLSILFCSNSPRTPPDVTTGSVSLWWTRLVARSMHSRWLIVISLTKVLCLILLDAQTCHANTDKARRHLLLFFYIYVYSPHFSISFSRIIGPIPSVIKKHLKWVNYNIEGHEKDISNGKIFAAQSYLLFYPVIIHLCTFIYILMHWGAFLQTYTNSFYIICV